MTHRALVLLGSAVVGLALAGQVSAELIPGSTWTVTAQGTSETFTVGSAPAFTTSDGYLHYDCYETGSTQCVDASNPCEIKNGDTVVAKVTGLYVETADDPAVRWGFYVVAGDTDTTFRLASDRTTFPATSYPLASANAAVLLSESDGNTASLTGLFSGSKAYEARYNDPAVTWAGLVDPMEVLSAGDSAYAPVRQPASGSQVIPATVDSIMSEFYFTLSAHDQASGTSTFTVTPEPSTFVLLGAGLLGMFAYAWRRKSAK
jgi:hypothetical protein